MIEILLALVVFGFVAWLVLKYIPMASPIREIVIGVMVLFLVIWLLSVLGLISLPVGLR